MFYKIDDLVIDAHFFYGRYQPAYLTMPANQKYLFWIGACSMAADTQLVTNAYRVGFNNLCSPLLHMSIPPPHHQRQEAPVLFHDEIRMHCSFSFIYIKNNAIDSFDTSSGISPSPERGPRRDAGHKVNSSYAERNASVTGKFCCLIRLLDWQHQSRYISTTSHTALSRFSACSPPLYSCNKILEEYQVGASTFSRFNFHDEFTIYLLRSSFSITFEIPPHLVMEKPRKVKISSSSLCCRKMVTIGHW